MGENSIKKTLLISWLLLISICCKSQIHKGYHGFIDAGYSLNLSGTLDANWTEINTVHGYQVNPYFFVGGGIGFHYIPNYESNEIDGVPYWKRDSSCEIPLFVNLRLNILNKHVTPFLDARLGHYLTNHSGSYMAGGVGCRFALKANQAIYVLASYTSSNLRYQEAYMISHIDYSYDWHYKDIDEDQSAISLKVGYEF